MIDFPSGAKVILPAGAAADIWHKTRLLGLGGSDCATVLDLNPWSNRYELYLTKIGDLVDDEESEPMYWGKVLEDVVAAEFEIRHHHELRVVGNPGTLQHPERRWQIVNLDRLLIGDDEAITTFVEAKTTNWRQAPLWEDDEVPAHVLLQVHHGLIVTGFDHAYVACLIDGRRFLHRRVEADRDLHDRIIEEEAVFWKRVLTRNPPPLDGSRHCTDLVKRLYRNAEPAKVAKLEGYDVHSALARYRLARKEAATWAEHRDQAKNELCALLGDAEIGVVGDEVAVTWKANGQFREAAFVAEHPLLANHYTRPVEVLDVEALKRDDPGLHARYRARRFHLPTVDQED